MRKEPTEAIEKHFAEVSDPRAENSRHKLSDIIVIAICGVICGADNWKEVENFGKAKKKWLEQYLVHQGVKIVRDRVE